MSSSGDPAARPPTSCRLTRHRSERLELYAILSAVALVAAVAAAQPGLVAFAAPFAVALLVGLAGARAGPPAITASIRLEPPEINEGDLITIEISLTSDEHIGRCEVGLKLPAHFELVEGGCVRAVALGAGVPSVVTLTCLATRWGRFDVGPVAVRVRDLGGLFSWEGTAGERAAIRVLPGREPVRHLVRARQVGSASGEQISRARGEGLELADIRQYVPGDRARNINWRVTARQRKLFVNEQHPDRNTDVVLFLDTFSEDGLSESVRIAWALADAYLARRDRVGLVGFGGVMSWIEPAGGQRQRERLTAALEDTGTFRSYAWKSVELIPSRALPARCLVLAVSPLLDERIQLAVGTLRARGLDVGVIEVPSAIPAGMSNTWSGRLALRIYGMEREMMRDRFVARGIGVVPWDAESGTDGALAQMDACRRHLRVAARG